MPSLGLNESEWSFDGFLFGGTTKWNDIAVSPPLMPTVKVDTIPKDGADGSWTYTRWLTDLQFTINGKYGASGSDDPIHDMFDLWAVAFAPRTTDLPLHFRLPGRVEQYVMARPIDRHFPLDRALTIGYTEWVVLMQADDATIHTA